MPPAHVKFITCAQKKMHSRSDSHGWAVAFVHSHFTVYRIICFSKMTWLWANTEDRGSGIIHWINGANSSFLTANTELREDMWSPSCQCLVQQAVQAVSPQGDLGQLRGQRASGSPPRAPGELLQKLWLWKVLDGRAKLESRIHGEKILWVTKGLCFQKF